MKRKTYTSPEVKARWNREHYDRMGIYVPAGARAEIQAIAAAKGMSVAAYIRHLIIADNADNPENTPFLRGGGLIDYWLQRDTPALDDWHAYTDTAEQAATALQSWLDDQHPGQLPLT